MIVELLGILLKGIVQGVWDAGLIMLVWAMAFYFVCKGFEAL